ncbi:MAG TPA: lasso peptide biosynthesis B2 protein [Polyangiaceae bacterium]
MWQLWNQPASRKLLAIEAAAYLVWARAMVARVPVSHWRRELANLPSDTLREPFTACTTDIVWAVEGVSRTFPERFTCLSRAVAVAYMLSRRGHACHLRIGVLPSVDGQLDAHAWVEHSGNVIVGRLPNLELYVELTDEYDHRHD